jgi:preprotein translocase subunit SecD
MRLIHPKNYDLVTRLNIEGKLEIKGHQLLSGHPLPYDGVLSGKKFWVENSEKIRSEHIKDVYCKKDEQEEPLSPPEYRKYTNYLKNEYPDGSMPIESYEEYLQDTQQQTYTVFLSFTDDGASEFAKVTRENVNRNLAIIIDRMVISQPVIYEEIYDGIATIYAGSKKEEADTITELIKYSTQHGHTH